MRAFIFSVWARVGETAAGTIAALKALAAKQYTVAEQGGRYVVSASAQGKSFTYELPQGQSPAVFTDQAYSAWRHLNTAGASGGVMTNDELSAYLLDEDSEYTDTVVAAFTKDAYYGS
jgi:hypothetical protein